MVTEPLAWLIWGSTYITLMRFICLYLTWYLHWASCLTDRNSTYITLMRFDCIFYPIWSLSLLLDWYEIPHISHWWGLTVYILPDMVTEPLAWQIWDSTYITLMRFDSVYFTWYGHWASCLTDMRFHIYHTDEVCLCILYLIWSLRLLFDWYEVPHI